MGFSPYGALRKNRTQQAATVRERVTRETITPHNLFSLRFYRRFDTADNPPTTHTTNNPI